MKKVTGWSLRRCCCCRLRIRGTLLLHFLRFCVVKESRKSNKRHDSTSLQVYIIKGLHDGKDTANAIPWPVFLNQLRQLGACFRGGRAC